MNEQAQDVWTAPESEVSVLGGMLYSVENIAEARRRLSGSEFFFERNRKVFGAILAVQDQNIPVDPVSVLIQLRQEGKEELVGGPHYLAFLLEASVGPATANIEHHSKVVLEFAERRKIRERLRSLGRDVDDPSLGIGEVQRKTAELLENLSVGPATGCRLPAPESPGGILSEPERDGAWLAEGEVPMGGNILIAAYPKSFKTFTCMELSVAAATGTRFLGRFETPGDIRSGLVLMEGGRREQAWRIHRLALSRGITGRDLDDYIHIWHRPPLLLNDPVIMRELAAYVKDLELDVLTIDAWAYVSEGNTNDDWIVTPQLMAISRLRDQCPDLTAVLVHHNRKGGADPKGERLTDVIRGSGSFGGWYDGCLVLARKDENSPSVTVRTELREHPSPRPFAFTVEDDEPACSSNHFTPQGALRLEASNLSPQTLDRREAAESKTKDVVEFIRDHPGCGKKDVRMGVTGKGVVVDAAVDVLLGDGLIRDEGGSTTGMKLFLVPEEAK